MPPKTVTCCVCGQEVLKSQTYATGDKDSEGNPLRACKEHEGVSEKAEELKEKSIENLKKSMKQSPFPGAKKHGFVLGSPHAKYAQKTSPEQREKDRELMGETRDKLSDMEQVATWAWTHCWCCEQKGIHLKDFYELKLIALEKGKMLGVKNPFSPEMDKIIAGLLRNLGVKCVMHRFEMDDKLVKSYAEWKNRIHYKCRPVAEMARTIQLCFECQERTGIKYNLEENLPKMDLKNMAILGASYDGSEAQKAAQVLAYGSILKDQEQQFKSIQNN